MCLQILNFVNVNIYSLSLCAGASGESPLDLCLTLLTCLCRGPSGSRPSSRVCRPRAGGDAGGLVTDALATAESTSRGFRGLPSLGFGSRLAGAVRFKFPRNQPVDPNKLPDTAHNTRQSYIVHQRNSPGQFAYVLHVDSLLK